VAPVTLGAKCLVRVEGGNMVLDDNQGKRVGLVRPCVTFL